MIARSNNIKMSLAVIAILAALSATSPSWGATVTITAPVNGSLTRTMDFGNSASAGNNQGYTDSGNNIGFFQGFNVTPYLGQTVAGNATLNLYYWQPQSGSVGLEVRVLDINNANMSFSNSTNSFQTTTGSVPWQKVGGGAISSISVGPSSPANIATLVPGSGFTVANATPTDTLFSITIPQATMQAILNGSTFAPIFVVDRTTGGPIARFDHWDTAAGGNSPLINNLVFATADAVPEPSTYALGLIGLVGLGVVAWQRKRTATC